MATSQRARPSSWLAFVIDAVLVLVFVLIGRGSHDEGFTVVGSLVTWWPFLAGLIIGWLIVFSWRRPRAIVWTGIVLWVSTVVLGMVLRVVSGQGTQMAFVIVATVVVAVFLLGWRAIALVAARSHAKKTHELDHANAE